MPSDAVGAPAAANATAGVDDPQVQLIGVRKVSGDLTNEE